MKKTCEKCGKIIMMVSDTLLNDWEMCSCQDEQDLTKAHYFQHDHTTNTDYMGRPYCICGINQENPIHPYEYIKTDEFQTANNNAEEKRFSIITQMLEDESEPFLERVRDWIDEYLTESYSRGD